MLAVPALAPALGAALLGVSTFVPAPGAPVLGVSVSVPAPAAAPESLRAVDSAKALSFIW